MAADLQATSIALGDALAEFASGDSVRVTAAIDSLCIDLAALPAEMEAETDAFNYGFTISLSPASAVVQPGDPATYSLRLANTGTQPTPIDLSLVDLPAGVAGALSQTSVTLAPGEVLDENSPVPITATLSSPTPLRGDSFKIDAVVTSKPSILSSTTGLFSAVEGAIDVLVVTRLFRVGAAVKLVPSCAATVPNNEILGSRAELRRRTPSFLGRIQPRSLCKKIHVLSHFCLLAFTL